MAEKKAGLKRLTGHDLTIIREALEYFRPRKEDTSRIALAQPAATALSQRLELIVEKIDQEIEIRKEAQ